MDDEKGVKQDAEGTPPSGKTGDPASGTEASPSPGEESIEFKDDDAKEIDSKKYVPLEALTAERKKRQQAEEQLKTKPEPTPEPVETPVEEPKQFELDWNAILGGTEKKEGEERPTPTTQPQKNPLEELNTWIRDNYEEHPVETMSYVFNMLESQRNLQKSQARKFVGEGYDKLPVHEVSDQDVVALQQNPEAVRALIAQSRFGRKPMAPSSPSANQDTGTVDAFKTREEAIRKEERQRVLEELKNSAGLSTEGATGGGGPAEEADELDAMGKEYARRRGIKDGTPEMAEFVKLYKAEIDRQAMR